MPLVSSASVIPSGTRQAISPVFTSMAFSRPQGGFTHGQRFESQKRAYSPEELVRLYRTGGPFGCSSIQPTAPVSFVLTKIKPSPGSNETPDQVAPPSVPGNT